MPRPFTRAQALENEAFIRALRRSGNIREAARAIGRAPATMHGRRGIDGAFAAEWNAAVAFAQAALHEAGGRTGPQGRAPRGETPAAAHRTRGGEMTVVTCRTGRLQLRAAQPGKLTRQCEQAFLLALSATANARLSAAAAGASVAAFYRRRRNAPAFAREWRLAMERGYEALQLAMLAAAEPSSHRDDAWRESNEPPDMPPMSFNQMLQLLYLHQKEVRLQAEPPHLKRRRGESGAARSYRLGAMYEAGQQRAREAFDIAEAARDARGEPRWLPPRITLPALDQVTGWSKADPAKTPHDPTTALFGDGGWSICPPSPPPLLPIPKKRVDRGLCVSSLQLKRGSADQPCRRTPHEPSIGSSLWRVVG